MWGAEKKQMKTLILLSLFLLGACGESPLWNHKIEKNNFLGNPIFVESEGSHFTKAGYSFSLNWKKGPELGEGQFVLKSWKTDQGTFNGPYLDLPYELKVLLWMPSMGHGSSPTKVTKLATGEYDVTNVYFIMGGNWEVKVQLIKDGKIFDEVILPYNI